MTLGAGITSFVIIVAYCLYKVKAEDNKVKAYVKHFNENFRIEKVYVLNNRNSMFQINPQISNVNNHYLIDLMMFSIHGNRSR